MTIAVTAGCFLVFANIALWLFFMPWYVERRISRFQNELVDKHYNEVESMYRKMRGWRHDYHNHIQTLKAHMELQHYEEAEDYLAMLAEDLTTVDTVIKTGNVMVDAILNSKISLARARHIGVTADACIPVKLSMSGLDLCIILGNLFDNAIEASM